MDQKKSVYEKPSLTKYGKLKDLTLIKKVSGPGDGPSLIYPST